MTESMIERVGTSVQKAISSVCYVDDSMLETIGRAAIEAMREPTDDMIMTALEHAHEDNRSLVIEDWGQMIDAALKEQS